MLEKLNQYRQNLTLPLRQKPAQNQNVQTFVLRAHQYLYDQHLLPQQLH